MKGIKKMGLAATQARMLGLTQRIHKNEYKLMQLAMDQRSLSAEKKQLDVDYDKKVNTVVFNYEQNFLSGRTSNLSNFSYSDLMGTAAMKRDVTSTPTLITDKNGRVVLSQRLYDVIKNRVFPSGGVKGSGNNNIDTKRAEFTLSASGRQGFENWMNDFQQAYKASFETNGEQKAYLTKVFDNIKINVTEKLENCLQIACDHLKNTYNVDFFGVSRPSVSSVNEAYLIDALSMANKKNAYVSQYELGVNELTDYVNNNRKLSFQCIYTTNQYQTVNKVNECYNNSDPIQQDLLNITRFYGVMFDEIVKRGYVLDTDVTDRKNLQAGLNNGTYNINGENINTLIGAQKISMEIASENSEAFEKITAWYNTELNKVKDLENEIQFDLTTVNAKLSALYSEKESLNSIIQKNLEKSFTYCQNG